MEELLKNPVMVILITNLPLVVGFFIAERKGWIRTGSQYDSMLQSQREENAFLRALREEERKDKKESEARVATLAEAVRESADVTATAASLVEKLLDDQRIRDRSTDRPRPRGRP